MNAEKYDLYRSTIRSFPPLAAEDASSLAWRAWLGDRESRQELVERHLWMVIELAERLRAGDVQVQVQLIAEGNRVLVHAAGMFRPWLDGEFADYARNLLLSEIEKEALPMA